MTILKLDDMSNSLVAEQKDYPKDITKHIFKKMEETDLINELPKIKSQLDAIEKILNKVEKRDEKNQIKSSLITLDTFLENFEKYSKSMTEKVDSLEKQNLELKKILEDKTTVLTKKITEQKTQIDFSKNLGSNLINRLRVSLSLFKSFNKILITKTNGGICGSLLRQYLELPVALKEGFDNKGYANPVGHDIDMYLYNLESKDTPIGTFNTATLRREISNMMKMFSDYINYSNLNPEKVKPIEIHGKQLVQIFETTLDHTQVKETDPIGKQNLIGIPHYVFKFMDKETKKIFEIDVSGWKPQFNHIYPAGDFDVNCLYLNKDGINVSSYRKGISKTELNFPKVLDHILTKEAECIIDIENIQKYALAPGILREQKEPYFMQIAYFLSNRLKLLKYGYNLTSEFKFPDFEIETKEDCVLTSCQAPYVSIKLDCSHKISIMSFMGIVQKGGFETSQSIKCPLCRDTLKISFKDVKPKNVSYPVPQIPEEILRPKIPEAVPEENLDTELISKDSIEFMLSLNTNANANTNNQQNIANNTNGLWVDTNVHSNINELNFESPTAIPRGRRGRGLNSNS